MEEQKRISTNFFRAALGFFLVGSILGVFLRGQVVFPLDFIRYKFWLHGHSHVILLGWVFNAIIGLTFYRLTQLGVKISHRFIHTLFWIFQISVFGMLIFFPIQGYGPVSIVFSTLHLLTSIVLIVYLIGRGIIFRWENGFLTWAWVFFLISSIGPLGLGILISKGLVGSSLYYLAIYFYLYFLYNGFFIFALFWLIIEYLKSRGVRLNYSFAVLLLMILSCIGTLSLSTLWTFPPQWVFLLGWISGGIQLLVLVIIGLSWKGLKNVFMDSTPVERILIIIFTLSFFVKIILQFISADLFVVRLAADNPFYIIGYLHLVFLGFTSCVLIYLLMKSKHLVQSNRKLKWGIYLFVLAFIASELLIISQPTSNIYLELFLVSLLFPIAIAMILIPHKKDPGEVS